MDANKVYYVDFVEFVVRTRRVIAKNEVDAALKVRQEYSTKRINIARVTEVAQVVELPSLDSLKS